MADLFKAASAVLLMCESIGDFRNGVTDPTGSIDEGEVRAGELLQELRDALASPPVAVQEERDAWQPIETVPASADDVLLATTTKTINIGSGHYARNAWLAAIEDADTCYYTHWQPMPKAPGDQP